MAQGEELLWVPKPGRGPTGPERLLASLASSDEDMVRRTSRPGFALWNPCVCLQRLRLQASLGTYCPGPARDAALNPLSFLVSPQGPSTPLAKSRDVGVRVSSGAWLALSGPLSAPYPFPHTPGRRPQMTPGSVGARLREEEAGWMSLPQQASALARNPN